jgi:hypothetical protein
MKLKWLLVLYAFLILASGVLAQTVSPITVEAGKGRAKAFFTARNDSIAETQVVTVVANSFTMGVDGHPVFRSLDPGVTVELNATSAKLGPNQQHIFDYNVRCEQQCAVAFLVTFSGRHISEGLQLAIHLATGVYVCEDSAKNCRARMRSSWGLATPQAGK